MVEYPEAWLRQGDINADGIINIKDVVLMESFYRHPASDRPEADLDGDGWISILDMEKLQRNFGLTYEEWVKAVSERLKVGAAITGATALLPVVFVGVLGR